MATITKRDLVTAISNGGVELTQQQIMTVIQSFIDVSTSHLAKGDEVVLRNFGTFQIRTTKPKIGRNPKQPKDVVKIPARKIVKFKPGKELKTRVEKLKVR